MSATQNIPLPYSVKQLVVVERSVLEIAKKHQLWSPNNLPICAISASIAQQLSLVYFMLLMRPEGLSLITRMSIKRVVKTLLLLLFTFSQNKIPRALPSLIAQISSTLISEAFWYILDPDDQNDKSAASFLVDFFADSIVYPLVLNTLSGTVSHLDTAI